MAQQTIFLPLGGGLDLVTPAIRTDPGRLIAALNYEPHPRGYRRIDGIERHDGRPAPSKATYWLLRFDAGVTEVEAGHIVTGATSGATGEALVDAILDSGTYAGSDAAGLLVLTQVTGAFQDGEDLQVSAATVAEADGTAAEGAAIDPDDDRTWRRAAIEAARAKIEKVPGSGPVRGVWVYKGDTYAFRNNVGGTAGVMHKATASGWAAQSLGHELYFDAGTDAFVEGETITGGTSGATATVRRVLLTSGDWSTNDAVGKLILSSVTGTFQNNETVTGGTSAGSASADGANAAITLPAGGRYEFENYNFFGAADRFRMYGANGVGRAFEWDGSVFVPIDTGMAQDKPHYIAAHKLHLFLSFAGGSLQHSGIGDPYVWSPLLGAAEIGIGEEITGLLGDVSGTLVAFGRNAVSVLYGNDTSDWQLDTLARDAGAVARTAQKIGMPIYLDDQGLRSLVTTQAFGNFRMGTLTQHVEPLLALKRRAGVTAVASIRARTKDQYRLFWSDGSGITVYLGKKTPEILPFDLGIVVECCCSAEASDGNEAMFFGDGEGFVYQMDAGTSFDGEPIEAMVRLPFHHCGSPSHWKRFHKTTAEIDSRSGAQIRMVAEFDYASPSQPPAIEQVFTVFGGGGFWDAAAWNEFEWSSPVEGLAEARIDGRGRNISVAVISRQAYSDPHILHGLTIHYSLRGLAR